MNEENLLNLLESLVNQPFLFSLIIIITTFILEDLATTAAALITAQTEINFVIPLTALFIGIVLGDIGLYALGKYSRHWPFLKRFIDHEKVQKVGQTIDQNLLLTILTSRFIPGMRLPTYTAIGAFDISFIKFLFIVIFAVALWTGGLFYLFYVIGDVAKELVGHLKWISFSILIILFVLGPRLYKSVSR